MPQLCGMQLLSAPTDHWKGWVLVNSNQKQRQPSQHVSSVTPMPMTTVQGVMEHLCQLRCLDQYVLAPAMAITAQAIYVVANEAFWKEGHTNCTQV